MEGTSPMTSLAPVLQGFFTEHLARGGVSPHTVASYRDTFRLLLRYARDQAGKPPSRLEPLQTHRSARSWGKSSMRKPRNARCSTRR